MGLFLTTHSGHKSGFACSRRTAVFSSIASALFCAQEQDGQEPQDNRHIPPIPNPSDREDRKLPNGKSQNDAIAKQNHEQALKDTNDLIAVAQQQGDELQKAEKYGV